MSFSLRLRWALACAALALAAGLVSLYALWGIDIRDSLEGIIPDARRAARWNGIGAGLNVVSSALTIVAILLFREP